MICVFFFRSAAPVVKSTSVKSIFISKPSTTTITPEPDEEYEFEDYEEEKPLYKKNTPFKEALEEEDPEVIKELITLIKRVGGLDELEKQLKIRLQLSEKSFTINSDKTTTMSPISQSLYEKVLSTRRGSSTQSRDIAANINSELSDLESNLQRQNKEHRYSSVVRNSRPRPQNDGLDKLPETEITSITRDRPQYVTITRTHAPHSTSSTTEDDSIDAGENLNDDEESAYGNEEKSDTTKAPPLSTHSYVSIRRTRPTKTSTTESSEVNEYVQSTIQSISELDAQEDGNNSKQSTRMPYVSIRRQRPTNASEPEEESTPEYR